MIVRKNIYKIAALTLSLMMLSSPLTAAAQSELTIEDNEVRSLVSAEDIDTDDIDYEPEEEDVEALYTNASTGYGVYIIDSEDLLTDSEEEDLIEDMEPITAYGDVAFESVYVSHGTTDNYSHDRYRELFGGGSGTLFVIDMGNRNIYIHSNGAIYRTITDRYAETITDNVYTYASKGDYYGCAAEVYREIFLLLDGRKIAQPMKYISNALLALILAFLINYLIVRRVAAAHKPKHSEIMNALTATCDISNTHAQFTHQTRVYDPPSKSSSGGGGGGHSGGGGGGGGGGHSF